jgi:hypothetical protein
LASYLAEHQSGIHHSDYAGWLAFITETGWAPSLVISTEHGVESGIAADGEDGDMSEPTKPNC